MRRRYIVAPILFLILTTVCYAETYIVERVVDGDTIVVTDGIKSEKVRLIGIDTPESKDNAKAQRDAKREGKDVETITKMGEKAYEFTKKLVEGKKVRLEFDVGEKDRYGRLLAYVYRDLGMITIDPIEGIYYENNEDRITSIFVNASIVWSGYASPTIILPNVKYADLFNKLYEEARGNKRGLWGRNSEQ